MSKIKAVVLEKSGSRYTVLDNNGTFRQVQRRQDAGVGEEIEIKIGLEGFKGLRVWAGVAAVFLVVLTTMVGWNLYHAPTAVALLSVDINPRLQFTIDDEEQVLKINTQNEDAKRLISKIDLKGKPLDEVLGKIVTEAYNQKFLNSEQPWVVVGYSPLVDEGVDQGAKDLNQNQIVSWLTENVGDNGFIPQVEVFALTPQDRELAQKGDLTLGEYALWQTAVEAGVETQPEKLKDTTERVRLLEDTKVRAKVKEKKEMNSYAALSKKQMPEHDRDKNAELQKYKQEIDQRNNQDKDKEENKSKGNDIKRDKEADRDKNRDINSDDQRSRGSQRKEDKDKGKEIEKEKGQEPKKKEATINTSDKARNNSFRDQGSSRERLSPLISLPELLERKGISENYSQLRWGTSRFQENNR